MKRISFLILFGLLIGGCDIIQEPYITTNTGGDEDLGDFEIENVVQKVILEEFTGHRCNNCPEAAMTINELYDIYGDRFMAIAYHAGYFAEPIEPDLTADYRTAVGEELYKHFNVGPNPIGTLNRTKNNNQIIYTHTEWPGVASEILLNEPQMGLALEHEVNGNKIVVIVRNQALTELNPLNVSVFLTEDSIISPQSTPDGIEPLYTHNHMFRMSLNGTWGTPIFLDGATEGSKASFKLSGTLNSEWDSNNMHIVCFAYDAETDEIIQVEAVKL